MRRAAKTRVASPAPAIVHAHPKRTDDASRDKLEFYAKVGVRELLIVDRAPWQLELYRLQGRQLSEAGRSTASHPAVLRSEVVPLSFRLVAGGARPAIEVTHHDGVQRWTV